MLLTFSRPPNGYWVTWRRLGLQARIYETERHPVVYGDCLSAKNRPTLLIYGHYDVQPPEPLDEWLTPPFSPTVRDGYVYARGAADDKGQFFAYLKAMEAILTVAKDPPRQRESPGGRGRGDRQSQYGGFSQGAPAGAYS